MNENGEQELQLWYYAEHDRDLDLQLNILMHSALVEKIRDLGMKLPPVGPLGSWC